MRGLAVAMVVAFHLDAGRVPGGFIGVSVFFTLSGFLITTLLVEEFDRNGAVDLRMFYARRARRLLPAAVLTIAAVLACARWWPASQRRRLGGDALAAIGNVANWRFAFARESYRELFDGSSSPLAHFWSLAIEEQFYLVFPLLAAWTLRRSRSALTIALAAAAVGALVAAFVTDDFDLAYHGTHVRLLEIAAGGLLAVWRRSSPVPTWCGWAGLGWAGLGWAGLGALVAMAATVAIDQPWIVRGGLVAVSISTCAVISGAGGGLLGRVLGCSPLRRLGRISYGVYLVHWPLLLLMTPERLGIDGWRLLSVRLAAIAGISAASYAAIEMPIRRRQLLSRPAPAFASAAAAVAAVALAAALVEGPAATAVERQLALGERGLVHFAADSPGVDTPAAMIGRAASGAPAQPVDADRRVLVLGSDGDAASELDGTLDGTLAGAGWEVIDATDTECPILDALDVTIREAVVVPTARCGPAAQRWQPIVDRADPDVILLTLGQLDGGVPRYGVSATDSDREPVGVTAEMRRTLRAHDDVRAAVAALTATGSPVAVVGEWAELPELRNVIAELDLASDDVVAELLGRPDQPAPEAAGPMVERLLNRVAGRPGALRLLVFGDSTSLPIAGALSAAADGALDVHWVGRYGCPLPEVVAVRIDGDVAERECASFVDLVGEQLDLLRPDVVLGVFGPTEFVGHRYPGDDEFHVVGSSAYRAAHDLAVAGLVELANGSGAALLLADTPTITPGAMATPSQADPALAADWNAELARWDAAWDELATLPLAEPLARYEARHGSIRPDGVHGDIELMARFAAEELAPTILAAGRAAPAAPAASDVVRSA